MATLGMVDYFINSDLSKYVTRIYTLSDLTDDGSGIWRRVLEGLYLPVRIREELRRPGGLAQPGTLLDQLD